MDHLRRGCSYLGGGHPETKEPACLPDTHLQVRQVTDTHRVRKRRAGSSKAQRLCLKKTKTQKNKNSPALAIDCSVNFHKVPIASSDHLFSFLGGSRKCTEGYFFLLVARNREKRGKEGDEIAAFNRCSVSL